MTSPNYPIPPVEPILHVGVLPTLNEQALVTPEPLPGPTNTTNAT